MHRRSWWAPPSSRKAGDSTYVIDLIRYKSWPGQAAFDRKRPIKLSSSEGLFAVLCPCGSGLWRVGWLGALCLLESLALLQQPSNTRHRNTTTVH
jgi:hypothetical protein